MAKKTKRNFIELIKEVNDKGEITKTKVYLTPAFIPFSKFTKKIKEVTELENDTKRNEYEKLPEFFAIISDLYNNQFTVDEMLDGLHTPEAMAEVRDQLGFFSEGVVKEENEARLKELLK
ncbi:hypothetical protein Q1L93_00110 [Mammaliicoccus sciuri]|uniref:phage tail assembly chaperone G n=1 Tax=Mammaliicoccus sciuri TaxID=1296 RepID=UPI00265C7E0D|nr:hypothetical protein [Mammaliicoccus sciuri]MDO0950194.1 hypothetical protein [Mammaliicoccus sciuri]